MPDMSGEGAVRRLVTEAGLAGADEADLLRLFCEGLTAEGIPLTRAAVLVDTLHPVHEGRAFRWWRDEAGLERVVEYGRTTAPGEAQERWRRSPFHHLLTTGGSLLRCRLLDGAPTGFAGVDELRAEGQTDHVTIVNHFSADGSFGEMDGVYSSWTTDHPRGFADGEVEALARAVPSLALAVKARSLARVAQTLVETYLGRDAARRVLGGRIERGVADRIGAALWFSDLRGYTRLAEEVEPDLLIPLLNDYAEAVISSIHEAGGDVLKLMGDGVLAVFQADGPDRACGCALEALGLARERLRALDAERGARGLPVTTAYLGLHVGEVLFGNIGSRERLDFTVVGPAVNEVSRIAAMCRSLDQPVLVSTAFREAASPEARARLVSVGRYALRGVARPQELFTLEPEG
jgi:adenylate cyclase